MKRTVLRHAKKTVTAKCQTSDLTCGRALGEIIAGGFLSEDRLGSVFLLRLWGFGLDEALFLKHLLLLPPQILLLYQLPPCLLLFFTQAVLLSLPSKKETKQLNFSFSFFLEDNI